MNLNGFLTVTAASVVSLWLGAAHAASPPLPPTLEDAAYQGYYEKPAFAPVEAPSGGNTARRFPVFAGSGASGDMSGVYFPGSATPGRYRVSMLARASAPGPVIRLGVSDNYASDPFPLTTEWQEYSATFDVAEPTDRAGQWFRQGNLEGGWIDVASFTVAEVGPDTAVLPQPPGLPSLPPNPEDDGYTGYFAKPSFAPVDSPLGRGTGRRFDVSSGAGASGDLSGVVVPGVVAPGTYRVSIYARASAEGPALQIGLDDAAISAPLALTTDWKRYDALVEVTAPTDRAGQWFRKGNIASGWIDVAGFAVIEAEADEKLAVAAIAPPPPAPVAKPAAAPTPVVKPASIAPSKPGCVARSYYVFFAPESTRISADGEGKLRSLAETSKAAQCKVTIEGFSGTSERQPVRWSNERAEKIRGFFAGLPKASVVSAGKGGTKKFGEAPADNRRVVILVRP